MCCCFFPCKSGPVIKTPLSDDVLEGAVTDRRTGRKCKRERGEGRTNRSMERIIYQAFIDDGGNGEDDEATSHDGTRFCFEELQSAEAPSIEALH